MAFERMTGQRRLILEAVLRADDHPTAMQVYERVAASMPNVSLTTVYRNLNRLTADGKIRRITIPNEPDRFDKTVYDHYHIRMRGLRLFRRRHERAVRQLDSQAHCKGKRLRAARKRDHFSGRVPRLPSQNKKVKEHMRYGTERI